MLMRDSFGRSLYQAFRLSSLMPTQKDTQSQIARKVNFAIHLLRETRRAPERPFSAPTTERSRATLSATAQSRWEPLWVLGFPGRSCGALTWWCSQCR
jgi:hypothetical protein